MRRVEEFLSLRHVLNLDGWAELAGMEPVACDRLIARFCEMSRSETRAVAAAAKALNGGLGELLWIMEHEDDGRDALVDAKRRDHQIALLTHDATGYAYNDPTKPSHFLAPVVHKGETLAIHGAGDDRRFRYEDKASSQVVFVDALSATLGVRPFPPVRLDTTLLRERSRAEVYQHVVMFGSRPAGISGDRIFGEKKAALEDTVALMKSKGRFWDHEAEQRKVRMVRDVLRDVHAAVRARRFRADAARIAAAESRLEKQRQASAKVDKARLILRALNCAEKWDSQQVRAEAKVLGEKGLLGLLNTHEGIWDGGIPRQNLGRSYLLSEWEAKVPITSAAAAATFGTADYLARSGEASREIADWRARAAEAESAMESRRKAKEDNAKRSEAKAFSTQLLEWRTGAKEIDDETVDRRKRERLAHVWILEKRAGEKNAGTERRAAMRVDALKRDLAAAERIVEDGRRAAAERAREAAEMKSMRLEEAKQRCVDDFWGLPTKWTYYKRLEAYKRKVWQARIDDRRKRMVQVGNSIAATEVETDSIRGIGTKEPWQRDWLDGVC